MTRTVRPARPHPMDDETPLGNRGMLVALLAVVLIAFGGFVWNIYGGREPVRVTPPIEAYKMAPSETMTAQIPDDAIADGPDAGDAADDVNANGAAEASVADAVDTPAGQSSGPPRLSAAPRFTGNGPFVAQLAALQSEEAVAPAWTRLSSRAPDLFGAAHMDVERADLGQRGVYYRIRAGYFADRTQAGLFCDRIRHMGQDCIVVAR